MGNALARLAELGQSVWYDFIRRDLLTDGTLERLIAEDRLAGMTSNPTIFEQAIASGDLYDEAIRSAAADLDPEVLFERIAVEDVRLAADRFRSVYDESGKRDGYVSLEVSPRLARDTEATIEAACRLYAEVGRPNVMIKIPGTSEGLPAVETCLRRGVPVNVTLLFSVERYREVMEAWFRGLEGRLADGGTIANVASVASFFVSRVDTAVDREIDARGGELTAHRSRLAVANARLAYQAWKETVRDSGRFQKLAERGAMLQRPLWASTSTKDPALPPGTYVDALVGPDTVNTMPPKTYEFYREHGDPAPRVEEDLDGARASFDALTAAGIDFEEIARRLEHEGVEKFARSYESLLENLEAKRERLRSA